MTWQSSLNKYNIFIATAPVLVDELVACNNHTVAKSFQCAMAKVSQIPAHPPMALTYSQGTLLPVQNPRDVSLMYHDIARPTTRRPPISKSHNTSVDCSTCCGDGSSNASTC